MQPSLKIQTATIASGAALSETKLMSGCVLAGIVMPAAWTAADLTFQVSLEGSTFVPLYDANGVEVSVKAAASRQIQVQPADFAGVRYLKLQSGLTGATVNQAADRAVTLITRSVL